MNTLSICSRADLAQARRINRWFDRPSVGSVNIRSPRMDVRTRHSLQQRIARLFNECGCGISAWVFVAATAFFFYVLRDPSLPWLIQVGFAALYAIMLAIASKAIVLAITHLRLNAVLHQLEYLI